MERAPRYVEDASLRGGRWGLFEGLSATFMHTSPYLTRCPLRNSSGAVHVVGASDTSVDLDPFEMWDEVEDILIRQSNNLVPCGT